MCKSITKKIISNQSLILISLISFMVWPCQAAVVFEDNFDSQADWNTNGQYEGAECSVGACASNTYPTNWNFYRSVPGASGFNPVAQIRRTPGNLPDHTTGSGKAYVVYNENSIQGSTPYPGDGIIGKYFGSNANYMDLYVQFWIRTQVGFRIDPTAQIKMFRMGHWRGTSNIYQWSAESSPMHYLDLARVNSAYGGGTGYSSSYRCLPEYYCTGYAIPSDDGIITALGSGDASQVWGDGNWHRIGIHAKMNTVGSSNGAFEWSYDGKVIKSFSSVEWKKSDSSVGWNFIALGGNSNNLFTSTQGADQWYAIDDIIVSTTPIVTPLAGAGSSISPSVPQSVAYGSSISFTVTQVPGYGILSVDGCNGTLTSSRYTTGVISNNCTVSSTTVARNANSSNTATPAESDVQKVMLAVAGSMKLTPAESIRYDVAPLGTNGIPLGNGVVDAADVILTVRRSIGIGNW